MSIPFNPAKLMPYTPLFFPVKAAVVGVGAVGSRVVEFLVQRGVGHITLIDYDSYTEENAAKHSCLVRIPEDVGRNKAVALARRAQALMVYGGTANGINADLRRFGPMAFADYDVVFLALDTLAAKLYFNQIWLEIPLESRPLLIYGGTLGEMAQANCLDGTGPCIRCLMDDSWLEDQTVHTSCTGPQYWSGDKAEASNTSGPASAQAALLMGEQFRAAFLARCPDGPDGLIPFHELYKLDEIVNKRLCYTAYPALGILASNPIPNESCPECKKRKAPSSVTALEGSVTTLTLASALKQIAELLGTRDFNLETHVLEYASVGYSGVIERDHCRCCGSVLEDLYVHEGLTRTQDMICPSCREAGKSAGPALSLPAAETVRGFSPDTCPEAAGAKTLFELGWPIGAYLYVIRQDPGADLIDGDYEQYCFTCAGDPALMTETIS